MNINASYFLIDTCKSAKIYLALVVLTVISSIAGPPPFTNLGFEAADPSRNVVPGLGTTEYLLPGWSLKSASNEVSYVGFDRLPPDFPASGGEAYIVSPTNNEALPVSGKYSLSLTPVIGQEMSIEQTGEIPTDAKSVRFVAFSELWGTLPNPPAGGFWRVSINGAPIDLSWTLTSARPFPDQLATWSVAGDISAEAGQEAALTISTDSSYDGPLLFRYGIDSIEFSPQQIPEPSSFTLSCVAIGLSLLLARTAPRICPDMNWNHNIPRCESDAACLTRKRNVEKAGAEE